jgi:DNA polymerase delta subunit 1
MFDNILTILFPHKSNNSSLVNDKIEEEEYKSIIQNAVDYVTRIITKIMKNEFDISQFIITRGLWLGTYAEDYKQKQAHVSLVEKLRKRDPFRKFQDGDR